MRETDHPWIHVIFNALEITMVFDSPKAENWERKFKWDNVTKICYKSYDYGAPNFLYISLSDETEKIILPIDDKGGDSFWEEVKRRGLFDIGRALKAEGSWNTIDCWPD